ncbi:RNA-binding protein 42-like [Actinia tenebrosa]|uniref:RNA-binding protein 42 n=1 Tax=Actinia tenebrosa TaxID=6105 RepID=A0A6P8I0E5_ACTTE|nr:RNA-binding protein 42-like [Actinia tenebrosa]
MSGPGVQDESERKSELEEEMSRFEQEILGHPVSKPPIISANTFKIASQAIQEAAVVQQPLLRPPVAHGIRPPPSQYFRPPNMPPRPPIINHGNLPPPPPNPMLVNPAIPIGGYQPNNVPPVNNQMMQPPPIIPHPAPVHQAPIPMPSYQVPMVGPAVYPVNPSGSALPSITPAEQKEWESAYTHSEGDTEKKKTKEKKFIRVAGNQVWEDASLNAWDPNDFRLFCGDLGNEVTDEMLTRAFSKYPSFLKAKIIRDKKSSKSKGYGFISFKDPNDFIKAMREMNGKYIGNRPIKLRKSSWKDRNMDVVRKKSKEKKKLGLR